MRLENVEIRGKDLVYKGLVFEEAEKQELADAINNFGVKLTESIQYMAVKIMEVLQPALENFRKYFYYEYKTEKYLQQNCPEFWLKYRYGN